jgi:hypothetical protein
MFSLLRGVRIAVPLVNSTPAYLVRRVAADHISVDCPGHFLWGEQEGSARGIVKGLGQGSTLGWPNLPPSLGDD